MAASLAGCTAHLDGQDIERYVTLCAPNGGIAEIIVTDCTVTMVCTNGLRDELRNACTNPEERRSR